MNRAPRVVSAFIALNVVGLVASTLSAIAGLKFAAQETVPNSTLQSEPSASSEAPSDGPSTRQPPAWVRISGGHLTLTPNDWESVDKLKHTELQVESFGLDRYEVTYADWATCGSCQPLTAAINAPNTPVVNVTPASAQVFCQHRQGRLPTRFEWVIAASTTANNRYPWGQTGLVCRNVVFGMVNGPCAFGQATQAVGSRPLGATESGVFDLAGNVAEWARDSNDYVALGGSFRSTLAGQLKVWALEDTQSPRDDIGFRCAYDIE